MSMSSEIAGVIEETEDLQLFPQKNPNSPQSTSSQPKTRDITLYERMISACSGSIITSLIVTPLDVVRVRLQQQELLLPSSNCCKRQVFWEASPPIATSTTRNTLIPLSSSSSSSSTSITAPGCSTSDHICITDKKMNGTWNAIYRISQTEGPTTLWRGLSLTLLMAAPANIVYFTGYEVMRDNSPIKHMDVLNPLLCGSIARVLAGTTVAPIELLKTRLQSIPSSAQSKTGALKNLITSATQEIKLKGPKALFRGLELTLWRDVPFSGIYWASYEYFKSFFSENVNCFKNDEYNLFLHSFLSGSISGSIAALATNPFDVGKTRLQISIENSTDNIGTTKKNPSMFKFMSDIWKIEGFNALYVGIVPRILKIAPSCAIMISSYELGKRFFSKTNVEQ